MIRLFDEVRLERRDLRGSAGKRVATLLAESKCCESHSLAIIAPGFGKMARNMGFLSRLLNRHGYATLRFDYTNHVGASEGDIRQSKLSSACADLITVLEHIPRKFDHLPKVLIASSLGARVSVRALSERDFKLTAFVGLLPATNFQATIAKIVGEDLVAILRRHGSLPGDKKVVSIMSYDVDADFLADALTHGFDSLESTRAEFARLRLPIGVIAAEKDEWVDTADILAAIGPLSERRRIYLVQGSSHNLARNPVMLRLVEETTMRSLAQIAGRSLDQVLHLDFNEAVETAKSEKRFMTAPAPREAQCEVTP